VLSLFFDAPSLRFPGAAVIHLSGGGDALAKICSLILRRSLCATWISNLKGGNAFEVKLSHFFATSAVMADAPVAVSSAKTKSRVAPNCFWLIII